VADGHDENDEFGLLKLADDAIVAEAIAPEAELAVAKRLTRGARVLRPADTRGREIPHIRGPTFSQERKRKKKSACSVRNDVDGVRSDGGEGVGLLRSE